MATDALPIGNLGVRTKAGERTQLENAIDGRPHVQRALDSALRSARGWRRFFYSLTLFLCTIIVVLSFVVLRSTAQSRLIPYVVQTDGQGRILNTEILKDRAVEENFTSEKTKKAEIKKWVEDWRTVVHKDVWAQKALATHVLNMVASSSEASASLVAWYKANDPVEKGEKFHVEATVKNVVAQSPMTYEVYWEEREINAVDESGTVSRWRNTITITVNPPRNVYDVEKNPYGLYVVSVSEPQKEAMTEAPTEQQVKPAPVPAPIPVPVVPETPKVEDDQ